MMNGSESLSPIHRASRLLPAGATLSAVAGLFHATGPLGTTLALVTAVASVVAAIIAWVLVFRDPGSLSVNLAIRFFSILGMALAFAGFVRPEQDLLNMLGVMGLWVAAGGAAIEWQRGRAYSLGDGG